MKMVISFDELYTQEFPREIIDVSDYFELTKAFLINQFGEWDFQTAFNSRTFQIDSENKEVSIEMIPI